MRYIILTLTLLFSLSTYSQEQKSNEKPTIQLGVEGTLDNKCLDNFENVKFNYEPESFYWGIDDFDLDLYCSRENIYYNFSTFDGRFTINFEFLDYFNDIILPNYIVTNKYERIV